EALIEASVRGLLPADYSPSQIESALETVFGVDSRLVDDGTYLVVQSGEVVVACGGWSRRRTLYGGDVWKVREDSLLDPRTEAAKIRAFFVHPDWARRGIGSLLLETCERQAAQAGFSRCEMGATLTGVPLYAARGYRTVGTSGVPLKNGEELRI